MLKKTFFAVLVALLVAFSAGTPMAMNWVNNLSDGQIDGMTTSVGGVFTPFPAVAIPLPDPGAGAMTEYVNPGGLGDALIYGYFNVRNGANLFNIVNTSPITATKVRVRFREGNRSAEILDFNVCLSAGDRWTALIVGDDQGPGTLYSMDDDTVTYPAIPAGGVDFKFAPENPSSWVNADETLEGYFEVISTIAFDETQIPSAMHAWNEASCRGGATLSDFLDTTEGPCDFEPTFTCGVRYAVTTNDIMGANFIVPLDTLESYGYNATAIADCTTAFTIDAPVTNDVPSFRQCNDNFFMGSTGVGINTALVDGTDYALTKADIYAAWDNRPDWGAETEIVITFPTMHFHQGNPLYATGLFDWDNERACDTDNYPRFQPDITQPNPSYRPEIVTDVTIWNDEEDYPSSPGGFSPSTSTANFVLCNEVNVIGIGSSEILSSDLRSTILPAGSWTNDQLLGWVVFDFEDALNNLGEANHFTDIANATTTWTTLGLPAVSYVLDSIADGAFDFMRPAAYDTDVFVQ
jgi:hypothetical protein